MTNSNQEDRLEQEQLETQLNDAEIQELTSTQEPAQPPNNSFKKFLIAILKEWVPSILIAFALWFLLSSYVIQSVRIPTGSMKPTIIENDRVMVLKFLYFDELEHGDIIVFYPPVKGKEDVPYIKRIIGLPGDQVETRNGVLFRNGKQVNESYIMDSIYYNVDFGKVPKGKYLFLGDNRNESADASTYATKSSGGNNWYDFYVSEDKIIGKALFRFYPLDRFGAIKRTD